MKLQSETKGQSDTVEESAPPEQLVKTWMWLPGLIVTFVLACLVMKIQYSMPIRETILALLMAFLFSFLAVQSTGATGETLRQLCSLLTTMLNVYDIDITPLTAVSTSSQVVLGAETSAQGWTAAKAQRLSLLGGALSAIGASQAAGNQFFSTTSSGNR